jgi:tripartite-type tricarboxylate transporter receptor subunit TctC
MRKLHLWVALATLLSIASAAAQVYPSRPIKIVVPVPPGATADTLPRIIADKLTLKWAQPMIIENRPGAAQNLGAELVAKAEPDGYTLLATPQGPLVISQHFYPKLGFDPDAFVPVTIMGTLSSTLVVNPKVPASTLQELIAFAKANPRSSATHLLGPAAHRIWQQPCWPRPPASAWFTCPTRVSLPP